MNLRIYSLSTHADFACRHSGACCTAGWPIPVERETCNQLSDVRHLLVFPPDAPPATPAITAHASDGACAFYEKDRKRCAIHRERGEDLLPVACRQFPRVTLADDRGLFVSLSHYCPTAAALLFEDRDLAVVADPPAFPQMFPFDPFDAAGTLPPLLHPSLLMDLETYDRWEREVVRLFAASDRSAEAALRHVAAFSEKLRAWTPRQGALDAWFSSAVELMAADNGGNGAAVTLAHVHLVLDSIPPALRPALDLACFDAADPRWVAGGWHAFAAPVRRYLAAKAFGTWLAYQARGLRSIVFMLAVARSTLRVCAALECAARARPLDRPAMVEAIRRTDELLVHLASREKLAEGVGRIEQVSREEAFALIGLAQAGAC